MPHFPKPFFRKPRGLWYVQLDGRQINLGPDRDEAFRRYHRLMGEPRDQQPRSDSLAVIIDAFLEWTQKHRAADTFEWYRYRLQRFIERYPAIRAMELRPYHVETWADSYVQSVTSRRNYLRAVKRCLRWAKKQGYIDANPIDDLEVPAAEAKEVYVSPAEFSVLLENVRNRDFADLLEVTYDCGCRPQELLAVTAEHVDLANQRWVFSKSESKGKRVSRVVYLPETALEITSRRLLKVSDGVPLFRNASGKPWTTDAVNCACLAVQHRRGKAEMQRLGESISPEQIADLIPSLSMTRVSGGQTIPKTQAELRAEAKRKLTYKRASELAPRYSLYSLRHSWSTNALKRGVDPLTVAILMGHQDPGTLSKVYQHLALSPDHMLAQARKAAG